VKCNRTILKKVVATDETAKERRQTIGVTQKTHHP